MFRCRPFSENSRGPDRNRVSADRRPSTAAARSSFANRIVYFLHCSEFLCSLVRDFSLSLSLFFFVQRSIHQRGSLCSGNLKEVIELSFVVSWMEKLWQCWNLEKLIQVADYVYWNYFSWFICNCSVQRSIHQRGSLCSGNLKEVIELSFVVSWMEKLWQCWNLEKLIQVADYVYWNYFSWFICNCSVYEYKYKSQGYD